MTTPSGSACGFAWKGSGSGFGSTTHRRSITPLVNLTNGNKTVEFDPDGNVAWKVTNEDVDGRFADPCGGQRLANGNTIICSYGQKDPKKPKLFEITPDKKVVWEFFHAQARAHEVHVITTNGKPEGVLK